MKLITSYITIFLLSSTLLFSQTKSDETLQNIRKLITEKQYSKAESLLSNYYASHADDLETNWLYAQVLHWNHKNDSSAEKFQKAIALAPKNTAIQLDYARSLYESGKLKKAEVLLSTLKLVDQTKAEALLMEANINFWNGNVRQAKSTISEINTLYPNTSITTELSKSIAEATAPYIKTNFESQKDNQPMTFFAEKIEVGQYQSWLLNPKLEISSYNFTPSEQALTAKLSNQFYFASIGLSTTIASGVYKNFSGKTNWIGDIDFNQKISKNISFKVGYTKKPYLGTQISTTYNLTQNNIFGEFKYENNSLFSIHGGYNHQFFDDKNTIETLSSWIISKPFIVSNLKIQVGYGFNYSNSKNNLYTSKKTLSDVIANYSSTTTIEGYYNPYFTPKSQMVNSALLVLNYKPFKVIELTAKGNYGFAAKCQNPYLYLDTDSSGSTIFATNSTPTTFNPFEVSGAVGYTIVSNIEVKVTYTHQETFFYNRNNINLALNYRF